MALTVSQITFGLLSLCAGIVCGVMFDSFWRDRSKKKQASNTKSLQDEEPSQALRERARKIRERRVLYQHYLRKKELRRSRNDSQKV